MRRLSGPKTTKAMVGKVGTSLMVPGRSDYYAENGNRQYFINRDDVDDQKWDLDIWVAGSPVVATQSFGSVNTAKAHAEKHDRDTRRAEGYYHAQLMDAGVSDRAAFGDQWADKYSIGGWTVTDAWADFNSKP